MIKDINFRPGDTVRVYQKISEGDPSTGSGQVKTRTQIFEGVVLKMRGRTGNKMFTVRKVVGDVAVERIFPIDSPNIEKVDVKAHSKNLPAGKAGKIRRAKLYFLRKQI